MIGMGRLAGMVVLTIGWYGCFACCLLESLFLGLSMSVGLVDIGRHVDWTKSVQ